MLCVYDEEAEGIGILCVCVSGGRGCVDVGCVL